MTPPYPGRGEELLGARAGLDARGPRAPRAAYGAVPPVVEYALRGGGTSLASRLRPLHARHLAAPPRTHRAHAPPQPPLSEPRAARRPPRAQPPPAFYSKAKLPRPPPRRHLARHAPPRRRAPPRQQPPPRCAQACVLLLVGRRALPQSAARERGHRVGAPTPHRGRERGNGAPPKEGNHASAAAA